MARRLLILVSLAILIVTPFLVPAAFLPDPVYEFLYGWRYPKEKQAGDCWLVDFGPREASARYVVSCGDPIDLTSTGTYLYSLSDLPRVQFTVGFDAKSSSGESLIDTRPISSLVSLTLRRSAGEVVIQEEASLQEWVWTGGYPFGTAFLYRRGETRDVPYMGGSKIEFIGVATDDGWGSYFTPKRGSQYKVEVVVLEPQAVQEELEVRLVARGGGWK